MSLIFGIFHRDQQTVDTANLAAMSSALAAYGPAGEGLWHDGAVGLGRRLLPFTATDDGPWEPVTDGRRVLAFAGQIYNREELINRFHLISEPAHPLSDPELLLRVLAARGDAGLPFVAGYFSFAWWHPEKQELLIGRSPLSAPPLFYHQFGANLAFAGMRKGLFALPWVPRALDETVLARYLIMAPIPPEQGFYREIAQLPPGHLLRANPEAVSTERYWQPDRQQTIYYPRDDDYVMAFNELFAQVIGEQIADSGKIGIMLSGGLDSSAVAAVAAPVLDATGAELTAFTEVPPPDFAGLLPPNRYADETPFV